MAGQGNGVAGSRNRSANISRVTAVSAILFWPQMTWDSGY